MSDSSVALGTAVPNINNAICQHRLPCGYCNLRNMMCPVGTYTIIAPCKPWYDQSITGSVSGESK